MYINEVKNILEKSIVNQRPVLLRGGAGCGKSSIIAQIASENDLELMDLRLPLLDATDLRGLPSIDNKAGLAKWLPPDFLPSDPDSVGILFLDELTSAAPMVQVAAFQLVLDRAIGNYKLPDGWAIVAAGNRVQDKSVVFKMPKPLANRFIHLNLDVDLNQWKQWAYTANIAPSIIGFLSFKEEYLYKDPKSEDDAFPTPRTWEFSNEVISWELSEHEERETLIGTVGEGAAREYLAYKNIVDKIPDINKILNGEDYTLPNDIAVLHSINSTLCYRYKSLSNGKPLAEKYVMAALKYIDKINTIELKVATVREFLHTAKVPIIGNRSETVRDAWRKVSSELKGYIHID